MRDEPPAPIRRAGRLALALAGVALCLALAATSATARPAYVANQSSGSVSVIDTATNQTIEVPDGNKQIKAGFSPTAIAITPDGRSVYVANGSSESVSVIDTSSNRAIRLPDGSREIKVGTFPDAIAITPDGKFAYVANGNMESVSVIETGNNKTIDVPDGNKQIRVGLKPTSIAITPDGRFAYVANSGGGVSVIDTSLNRVVPQSDGSTQINAGTKPSAVAISPDQAPLASFQFGDGRARPGVPISLDASSSTDPDSPIATYAWSFGDGQAASLDTLQATHAYGSQGTYQVSLTTTDAEGCATPKTFLFTGQTAYCQGSSGAQVTRTIAVTYPGVQVGCPKKVKAKAKVKVKVKVKSCSFKLQAIAAKPRKGKKAKTESAVAKTKVKAGGSAIVSLEPTADFAATLAAASSVLVKETMTAGPLTKTRFATLGIVQ